jgi:Fe-S oxidoreductase/FAD/FMN-containing dehydrogenase
MERTLYGHDIAEIPSLIKPLVGSTVPDAVVQPASEEELVALVRWAQENRIALTPRGRASSGYGGVLPVKGGLVVDFFHLSKLLEIDTKTQTARVQPGICWEKLDRELAKKDLTLRLYPSSYPAATVGGWLAQGGAGFGSYESGWFRDNVVSARAVLANGTVREFSGSDLDLVSEAEGTTGLISEVTVKVMPKERLGVISIGCPDAYDLQRLVERIVKDGLPIWSLSFINPRMAEMKNRAPLRMHAGHAVGERVLLPASYVMTLAFREKDRQRIDDVLPNLFKTCQAELLSDKVAHHEWDNRFEMMVVKRLGPSLVPAEVVIPLSSLGDMMAEVERKVSQPVVKEGLVIREGAGGNPEVVILGFIPSDQRKFSYNFIFPLSLTIMKIAERNGGKPYATGLYFAGKASQILGRERLGRLKAFKARVDPGNILNPGKVMQGGLMASALSLGAAIEPLIRPIGNHVISKIGERPTQSVRDIPADVAWYAYTCSQCGYCVAECDQFYGRGWESQSPRGKWYWLREYMAGRQQWDQQMVDTFLVCTTCEMCDTRCSTNLPIEPSWMKLRGMLINEEQRMTFPPFEMMAAALKSEGNIWAGYRKDRMDWYPADLKAAHPPGGKAKNVYFAGCTASYVEHDIGQASVRLLDKAGVDFVHLGKEENCCGTPMLVAGRWDLFAEIMKRNIELVKQAGADTVIASCPACDMMWRQCYPEWAKKLGIDYPIKARHYSEILAEQIEAGKFRFPKLEKPVTVTWHDSCHIGRASGVYEPPRDVIQAIPNVKLVEMSHNREQAHCCASVLTLIKEPPVAADIGKVKLDEALAAGAEKILSLCPCCQVQLRVTADKKGVPIEVQDLAHFAAAAFGYTFPDPNPEVRKQWAVFDAFIKLLTPQGFADLMGTMWPDLIDAMPLGMGRMMRLLGKVPGALRLMRPMFPVLFPRLLPLMLPKVLATMLRRVEEQIEMPKYMREQMPDLMPKVMDRLMPHMIGDMVPLITQPMIDYLRGKS